MAHFVYFAAFMVLCGTLVNTLETTTSPQQQTKGATKDQFEKSICYHGFPGIPGANGMPGIPGAPGPQGTQGRDGAKEMIGMKGERGLVGNQGIKGDKGEKGESVTSPSSAVPQANWKQCVWKGSSGQNNGKIKDCSFHKLECDTAIKVSFSGNMGIEGRNNKCNRWFFKFNGSECSGPMTIEALVYQDWNSSDDPDLLRHRSFGGYCENIPEGTVRVELWIGPCPRGDPLGDATTGWYSVSRIMIEEVSRSQA